MTVDDIPASRWMAPECVVTGVFTVKSDVWSFGIVAWEIASDGCLPYVELSNVEVLEKLAGGYRLPRPDGCPMQLYRTIFSCWSDSRPTFESLSQTFLSWVNDFGTFDARESDELPEPSLQPEAESQMITFSSYAPIDRRTLSSRPSSNAVTHEEANRQMHSPGTNAVYRSVVFPARRRTSDSPPQASPAYTRVSLENLELDHTTHLVRTRRHNTIDSSSPAVQRSSLAGSWDAIDRAQSIGTPGDTARAQDPHAARAVFQHIKARQAGAASSSSGGYVKLQRKTLDVPVGHQTPLVPKDPAFFNSNASITTTASMLAPPIADHRMQSEPDLSLSSGRLWPRDSEV